MIFRLVLFSYLFMEILPCHHQLIAKEFLRKGEIFPIIEENLAEVIQRKRQENLFESGDTQKRVVEKIRSPNEVSFLQVAQQYRKIYFDPSFVVRETIKDNENHVIIPAGKRVNPLELIQLSSGLLFFDGTKENQVSWARQQNGEYKWILVKGSPLEIEKREKRPVYFDQGGLYSKKFGLKYIPARIVQEGKALVIEEFPL